MKISSVFLSLIVISLVLVGCSSQTYNAVQINLGKDSCYTCHMGVADEMAASQALLEDGTPRIFDDIGCLVVYLKETKDKVKVSYVHDQKSKNWIEFAQASFVHEMNIETPMNYGLIAFSKKEDADQYQKEHGGEVMSSQELLEMDVKSLKKEHSEHQK